MYQRVGAVDRVGTSHRLDAGSGLDRGPRGERIPEGNTTETGGIGMPGSMGACRIRDAGVVVLNTDPLFDPPRATLPERASSGILALPAQDQEGADGGESPEPASTQRLERCSRATRRRMPRRPGRFAMRFRRQQLRSGSTQASFGAVTRGIKSSGVRSAAARPAFQSSRQTGRRAARATFGNPKAYWQGSARCVLRQLPSALLAK
jgi:hypothetical protein